MFMTESKIIKVSTIKKKITDYEKIVMDLDLASENIHDTITLGGNKKRMRLHQLSWEEKIQRKKMRNRIAAQTSRDRKKAKMDHLEETVKELKEQNELLFSQVEELKKENKILLDANTELQKTFKINSCTCSCLTKVIGKGKEEILNNQIEFSNEVSVGEDHSFIRPAEPLIPQQKGQWSALTQGQTRKTSSSVWKIFLLYLISQKCWEISRETHSLMTLKDWQHVCWRMLNSMKKEEMQNLYSMRFQKLAKKNAPFLMNWWGTHQKSWNPVEVK